MFSADDVVVVVVGWVFAFDQRTIFHLAQKIATCVCIYVSAGACARSAIMKVLRVPFSAIVSQFDYFGALRAKCVAPLSRKRKDQQVYAIVAILVNLLHRIYSAARGNLLKRLERVTDV